MCGPWALPLALLAGGTAANYFGEQQARHAQDGAFNAEQTRQKDMTNKQQASFEDSLKTAQGLSDPNAVAKAADTRAAALSAAIVPASATSYLPGSASAPDVVHTAQDVQTGKEKAYAGNLATALAKLGGAGDQLQGTNIALNRDAQDIGQQASFKAGSAGVLDSELQAAAHKGQFLRGAGSLASKIGAAWLGAGAAGGMFGSGIAGVAGAEPTTFGGLPGVY